MSGSRRTTLKPGDLVYWDPDPKEGEFAPAILLVGDDSEALIFQFAVKPWHQIEQNDLAGNPAPGYRASELVPVLKGDEVFRFSGRIFKCYDATTDSHMAAPNAEEEIW